jgi:hypothetical protein
MLSSMLNTIHNLRRIGAYGLADSTVHLCFVDAFYTQRRLPTPPLD